jgi:hypothetical protein
VKNLDKHLILSELPFYSLTAPIKCRYPREIQNSFLLEKLHARHQINIKCPVRATEYLRQRYRPNRVLEIGYKWISYPEKKIMVTGRRRGGNIK